MHVALLFQHYHTPDCATAARPYSLVRHLAQRHEVTLITTDAYRRKRITRDFEWVPPSVRHVELQVPYENAMATPARFRSYASFLIKSMLQGARLPRPDVIFGSSTPLTVGLAASVLARRFRVPWIFEVRDLWPAFPIQMGAVPFAPLQQGLEWLERHLYQHATRVVTASPDMSAHVRQRAPAAVVHTVPYGTDFRLLKQAGALEDALAETYDLRGNKLVCYAGNFGRANAIPTLLEAFRTFTGDDVTFAVAGAGFHESAVRDAAARQANVRLLPPLPLLKALALFRLADLSIVPFIDLPVLGSNAPSKLFDSLAAGTPVIVTNPGWTKSLVEQYRCGWAVPPEDADALARQIGDALGSRQKLNDTRARATSTAQKLFDRETHMERIVRLIEQTC